MKELLRNEVPQGRLSLAQDAVLGLACTIEESRRDDWSLPGFHPG
jgi:hypothetical protein